MKERKTEEKRDQLGYTFGDYIAMQDIADREDKRGDILSDGWDISAEQIALINDKKSPFHGVAVLCFYDVNKFRLECLARSFIRHHRELVTVVEEGDLLNQLVCDLLCGEVKLPYEAEKLSGEILRKSFEYAAVGGAGEIE